MSNALKIISDRYNHLNSELSGLRARKLTKRINVEGITRLELLTKELKQLIDKIKS